MTTPPIPSAPRQPPRFVPTLTQVVPQTGASGSAAVAPTNRALPPLTSPPRPATPASALSSPIAGGAAPAAAANFSAQDRLVETAEQLRQRLLLRAQAELQLTLERQVREAVSSIALQQVGSLVSSMKPALEAAVNRAVAQAVDHALGEALAKELGTQKR